MNPTHMQSTEERMKRQQLQLDEQGEPVGGDVIDTRGETVETVENKPLVTPVEAEPEPMQTAAPKGESVPNEGFGTPDLPEHGGAQASERWQRIQAEFVDDPRKAVGEAHELVGDLVQRIVDAFTRERTELENQWSKGDSVSTEDLRVCLQHYRAFFSRLLPSAQGIAQP
jgi:hypothetical protein